jgi:hypothetical protein
LRERKVDLPYGLKITVHGGVQNEEKEAIMIIAECKREANRRWGVKVTSEFK